jgi:exopolysaccharide biosynthesis polyprenyl glycosylphosphotransferase
MLRAHVTGFLSTSQEPPDAEIRPEQILGSVDELATLIGAKEIDEIVLTDSRLDHDRIVQILLLCEHNLITFKMVPDLFRIMTTSMDVQSLNDIPLLGISTWPLDKFWNCLTKRIEDIVGALVGLFVSAPIIAVAAILVKRSSPGPIFYRQERCGEEGRSFTLYKLRTMPVDAEAESGPVWTVENDARRTAIGGVLRRYNLDELPQFWNVLRGDMSLVGPRPERPHFVEKFKEDIGRYMWRHVSKPGLTGWAQVNGLRGNTDLGERIKYDLFYLENWSLVFDFKILVKTFSAKKNAY